MFILPPRHLLKITTLYEPFIYQRCYCTHNQMSLTLLSSCGSYMSFDLASAGGN